MRRQFPIIRRNASKFGDKLSLVIRLELRARLFCRWSGCVSSLCHKLIKANISIIVEIVICEYIIYNFNQLLLCLFRWYGRLISRVLILSLLGCRNSSLLTITKCTKNSLTFTSTLFPS